MRRYRKAGPLGLAMLVVVGGLMLGATPASAVAHDPVIGTTHYENVGNPTWCLDGNGTGYSFSEDRTSAYLHRCGHGAGQPDFQVWGFTNGQTYLQLVHNQTNQCLTVSLFDNVAYLGSCAGTEARWDAVGKNGWVMLVNRRYNMCLRPIGTGLPGYDFYWLALTECDRNPLGSVPNIIAWRYFNS